jgi:redox-sensitive bicupin YhaK (pirin superfamily)
MTLEVRRAADRFRTDADGHTSWHSFSFGTHYDPRNVGFGALQALNDERLPEGTGYPDHPHRDTEIVTVVLTGALRHRDDAGRTGVLVPGDVQLLSAGTGVVHSEVADDAADGPTRFLQAWLRPDEPGLVPSYAGTRAELGPSWSCLASGEGDALPLHTRGAALHAARLDQDEQLLLPDAPRLHLFVATGAARLTTAGGEPDGSHDLATDDAARLLDDAGTLTATVADTLVVLWALAR